MSSYSFNISLGRESEFQSAMQEFMVTAYGQMRLVTEMYLGMLRSIILYRGDHDTPDTMAPLAVHLFLDGLSNLTPSQEHSNIRLTVGGKSRVRATVRRATTLG